MEGEQGRERGDIADEGLVEADDKIRRAGYWQRAVTMLHLSRWREEKREERERKEEEKENNTKGLRHQPISQAVGYDVCVLVYDFELDVLTS